MTGKWLYLEFLIPVKDYLTTLKPKEFVFDWIFPISSAFLIYIFVLRAGQYSDETEEFIGNIINVLGVLFGFSIASITLLITTSSESISRIKRTPAKNRRISGKSISIYQLTIITFTFLLFLEVFGLLLNFGYSLAASLYEDFRINSWRIFYSIDCFLLIQVIALNIRNTTNIYFVFLETSKANQPPN
ncbi:MAG: hypothetical protein AAGF26_18820 [Cyanobacteria bacterium P01_G01_bin.49]